ncbi:hypothetical protein [Streptococcus sp. 2021WUSS124]|uniref:hypothetical protein n=1 Tax=unclassified Streptococcus TaxID=2608887 RepID=UPI0037BD1194
MIGRWNQIDDIRNFMRMRGAVMSPQYEAELWAMKLYDLAVEKKIQRAMAGV